MNNQNSKNRVVVAMSGGVDSSVAAALLAHNGYEVIGVTMRLFDAPFENAGRLNKSCCSLEDVEDARITCRIIGARHVYLNFVNEFKEHVMDYFVKEYEAGRTPHPCVACNDRLKFDFLFKRATLMDVQTIATGHYARKSIQGDRVNLLRAVDPIKDQSYVLYNLTQHKLRNLLLPVGEFKKEELRLLAKKFGLPVADKPDSQDICFIPTGSYREFVEQRITTKKTGLVKNKDGKTLGEHKGVHNFTIGQRKGLPVNDRNEGPLYVTNIDATTGDITVGPVLELMKDTLYASKVNWISGRTPSEPLRVTAKIRYNGREDEAEVKPIGNHAEIKFSRPVRAITPGQPVVFYNRNEVLGGGIIELTSPKLLS